MHDRSDRTDIEITGDLIIDNESITYENQRIYAHGDVIVRNGGEMILNNSTLAIVGTYDEQYSLYMLGNSKFRSFHSQFIGEEYQTSMICRAKDGASPVVHFENSYAENHLGVRPFGETYTNTQIEYFNIYTYGSDQVEINGSVVNETNTFGSSSLSAKNCSLEYNLVQSFDLSHIVIEDGQITDDTGFTPSVTSDDDSLIEIKNTDCQRLTANALANSTIKFYQVDNLMTGKLHKQDNGKVFVYGVQVK